MCPFYLQGVALDSASNVYTVNGWDEPHFDVIKWSPVDGQAMMNTGHCISEALLKGVAVEPDGSYAYVTGASDSDDRSKSRFTIYRVSMAPGLARVGAHRSILPSKAAASKYTMGITQGIPIRARRTIRGGQPRPTRK